MGSHQAVGNRKESAMGEDREKVRSEEDEVVRASDEDVEGHKLAPAPEGARAAADDDDVEAHVFRHGVKPAARN
jgi:hypothetical protein